MSDSLALLVERFRDTRLPDDPRQVELPVGSDQWPPSLKEEMSRGLKPAGVLIPLMQRDSGVNVLLTRRSAELKHHAGQVSFPGGSMEEHDADIGVTALRETEEEVGIPANRIRVLGHLNPLPTVTGFAVTPTIGLIETGVNLRLDRGEVELAFEVPLDFLLDERNYRKSDREIRGRVLPIMEVHYEGERIWGATAYMLLRLIDKINKNNK